MKDLYMVVENGDDTIECETRTSYRNTIKLDVCSAYDSEARIWLSKGDVRTLRDWLSAWLDSQT